MAEGFPLSLTPVYALPLVALYLALSVRVVRGRYRLKISLGDGSDPEMRALVRTHGNAAEFIPLGLVLLLIAELAGAAPLWLHVAGLVLVAGRLCHAWAVGLGGPFPARVAGMALTFTALAVSALAAVV
jgi:uncharacterized membrane protein YecN with MAPEG domain